LAIRLAENWEPAQTSPDLSSEMGWPEESKARTISGIRTTIGTCDIEDAAFEEVAEANRGEAATP